MNCFSSDEYKGTSIISYSSLGDDITEPYKVLSLSALSLVVDIPLAISFVIFLLPTLTESQKIYLEFSKTDKEVDDSPRSIHMLPKSLSSLFNVDKAEERGVGIKFSIWISNSLNKFE